MGFFIWFVGLFYRFCDLFKNSFSGGIICSVCKTDDYPVVRVEDNKFTIQGRPVCTECLKNVELKR